jgi:cell division protein FtsA
MSRGTWTETHEQPPSAPATSAPSTDRLRSTRWFGRVADFARNQLGQAEKMVRLSSPQSYDCAPEHLVVIAHIASKRVSATIAMLHPEHGDKVIAHKSIECDWHRLTQAGKQEALADVVRLACDSAGVEAFSLYVSMSDPSFHSRLAVGWADPGDDVILSEHERLWALKRARDQATGADVELIDAIPVQWTVRNRDGEREVAEPVGERGSRLTCQALLITARRGYHDDVRALINGLGLELEGIIAQPVALFRGINSAISKKASTIIIDCGARTTTILVRRKDRLVHIESYPFGGDDLTKLLAEQLQISIGVAEDVKRELDISQRFDERDHHVGQQFIWSDVRERHRLQAPATTVITEAIAAFFKLRVQELRDHGYLVQNGQVHLVGRASALGGLTTYLKDMFNLPVVLGSGHKHRDPSAEMADVVIGGLVCTAADLRRTHIAKQTNQFQKTASGMWNWLTRSME